MATTNATVIIQSDDLLSSPLNISQSTTLTENGTTTGMTHTTGLARQVVTSTAKGTASGQVTIYTADDFAATPYLYIKNCHTTAGNYLWLYDGTTSGNPVILKMDAQDFAFMPIKGDMTLKMYATTNPTTVEFVVIGKDQ